MLSRNLHQVVDTRIWNKVIYVSFLSVMDMMWKIARRKNVKFMTAKDATTGCYTDKEIQNVY